MFDQLKAKMQKCIDSYKGNKKLGLDYHILCAMRARHDLALEVLAELQEVQIRMDRTARIEAAKSNCSPGIETEYRDS